MEKYIQAVLYAYPYLKETANAYGAHIQTKALFSCDGQMEVEKLVEYLAEEILQKRRLLWLEKVIDDTLEECNRWERALLDSLFFKRHFRSQRLRDKERERLVALELDRKRSIERDNCLMKVQYKLQRAGITKELFEKELIPIPLIQKYARIVLKKREKEKREDHSSVS